MARFTPLGHEDPMSILCRMVFQTQYEDLSAKVVSYAKHYLLDTMAVIIGGSDVVTKTDIITVAERKSRLTVKVRLIGSRDANCGSVNIDPSGDSYERNTVVTVTAIPSPRFDFAYWSGDISSNNPKITIPMDSDRQIVANFVRR